MPRTLGLGVPALLVLIFATAVTVMIIREQRRPPEFAGVFDAQPLQGLGVAQQHDGTIAESRDDGAAGLGQTPSARELAPPAPVAPPNGANRSILDLLPSMPSGGGSEANAKSLRDLEEAIQVQDNQLKIKPAAAQTTYSAGATYLVFLRALQSLLPSSTLSGSLAEALTVKGQPDGAGVWGRWNANGPGTACLFDELGLGRNFTSLDDAQPGDFMKVFFADAVGRREHSLSTIYLGREQQNGVETVRVWSSIKPVGYGEAVIPRARISFAIFSRLENPANIAQAPTLTSRNKYLASLLTTDSSKEETMTQAGVR
ncbi:MAG: hypothetical protein JO015_11720 [Verrucomicrobia bacterium]|nr:hypothetical protein [Verrucomicrobiota bacterium]